MLLRLRQQQDDEDQRDQGDAQRGEGVLEAALAGVVQEVVDLLHRVGVGLVPVALVADLAAQHRLQQRPLIGAIEHRVRQSDLAQGRADVPDRPRLAGEVLAVDQPELAHIGEEAGIAQAFGHQPVVDPAFVPGVAAAVAHELDDRDDDEQFERDQRELQDRVLDIGADHGDQHRRRRQQVGEHIGVAIEMRELHRQRIGPGMARRQHVLEPLAQGPAVGASSTNSENRATMAARGSVGIVSRSGRWPVVQRLSRSKLDARVGAGQVSA